MKAYSKIYGFFGASAYGHFLHRLSMKYGRPVVAIALRKMAPKFHYHRGHLVYKQERFKIHIIFSDNGPDIFINPPVDFPLHSLTCPMGWASEEYLVENLLAGKRYFVNRQSCTCPARKPCKHQTMIRPELNRKQKIISFSDAWEQVKAEKAAARNNIAALKAVPKREPPFPIPLTYRGDFFKILPHVSPPGQKPSQYCIFQIRGQNWEKAAQSVLFLGDTDKAGVHSFALEASRRGVPVVARSREGVDYHFESGKWVTSLPM